MFVTSASTISTLQLLQFTQLIIGAKAICLPQGLSNQSPIVDYQLYSYIAL